MTAVSMNRAEMSLKSVQNDGMRSCTGREEKHHYDIKSMIMPLRGTANITDSTGNRGGNVDQASINRQPISAPTHSYSTDSDSAPNTTTASSATAMRRLYFKSAKLSKTTSMTTVHQQQAQHVPKVNKMRFTQKYFVSINKIGR